MQRIFLTNPLWSLVAEEDPAPVAGVVTTGVAGHVSAFLKNTWTRRNELSQV